jgi:hypothetical protein
MCRLGSDGLWRSQEVSEHFVFGAFVQRGSPLKRWQDSAASLTTVRLEGEGPELGQDYRQALALFVGKTLSAELGLSGSSVPSPDLVDSSPDLGHRRAGEVGVEVDAHEGFPKAAAMARSVAQGHAWQHSTQVSHCSPD